MAFKVYKPKGVERVKADQISVDTVKDLEEMFMGRMLKKDMTVTDQAAEAGILEIPTLNGTIQAQMGDWLVRTSSRSIKVMTDTDFQNTYELAYNTTRQG